MKVIEPSYEILTTITGDELKKIEQIGRVCYKSEDNITDNSDKKFVKGLINRGHEAMLEHLQLSVRFICDRGISHELVRHRLASFAQESTRYCNYSKDKFGRELTFIKPFFFDETSEAYSIWEAACLSAEDTYLYLLELGRSPQEARSVLPNSLKTEVVMTANYREWRHFFRLRVAPNAHPQMQELCIPLIKELQDRIPIIFDDIDDFA